MTKKIGLYRCKTDNGTQWRVRWFGKYDPNTGKPKRYSKTFVKKKDAERFQKVKDAELDRGGQRDPSAVTLKGYAEQWLQDKTQNIDLRPATVMLYRQTLDRLYNYFGAGRLLRTINREEAKSFMAGLQPLSSKKKKLTLWTRHRIMRNCITLFGEAIEDGKISKNPFSKIMKGATLVPSEWYKPKTAEYFALLDATPALWEKTLYALAYTAGLRVSEALSLCWPEVDFEKGRVRVVNRPATENLPSFGIKDKDVRCVPVPKHTLDLLLQLHEQAPEKVPYVLLTKQRYDIIVAKWKQCCETGRPWLNQYIANNITRNFHQRVHRAGIKTEGKSFTPHTLRKCCSQIWQDGLPMNAAKVFLGHSSIKTTEKFYSQVDDAHYVQATKVFDDAFDKVQNPKPGKAGGEKTDLFLTFSGDSGPNQDVG